MNRRWMCGDIWLNILPFFDRAELGLNLALLSDRYDALVDTHFNGREFTLRRAIEIRKDNGPKPKVFVLIDDELVEFPLPDRPLPNKIRFDNLKIEYIDHSVIEFLRSNKQIWDRSGTNLGFNVNTNEIEDDQPIWDVLAREIWPVFATNIRHLCFSNGDHLDNLRRRTSLTILTDLDHLNAIHSGALLPDEIADDGLNATAGEVLSKWLHTPSKDGQPKRLHCVHYYDEYFEWINSFKKAFLSATTSVSYSIQLYFRVKPTPNEPFELVNKSTQEKLTLWKKSEDNCLLKRCPIIVGETAIRRFIETHLSKRDTVVDQRKVILLKGVGRQKWELAHSTITQGAELGKGAFGVVKRGVFRDPTIGQPVQVAIKEVSQTSTKAQIKEFMNEARIMRHLEHKNVIKFYGVAVGREPLMVLMELASDGSLDTYLKKTKRSPRSKLFMCYGAAAGLDHVHSKGILHCDIAARNCLFSENTVKVADFGLAFKGPSKPVETGKPVPIRWLSPETMRERTFTPKSDTWAYGVLCWEIFSNAQQPYQFMSNNDVAPMVLRGTRLRFPNVTPPPFAEFIRANVWTADDVRRYSMRDVLAWIEQHIDELIDDTTASRHDTTTATTTRNRGSRQGSRTGS
ncbi:hypothetical protein niasHT_014665 [Heterodera trifolii]|uniref:Protein kinase domain-containing protein n=1 Tax=Heterodera trifolii TaxID=157864 RepID=A0ABD2LIB9_9BILA